MQGYILDPKQKLLGALSHSCLSLVLGKVIAPTRGNVILTLSEQRVPHSDEETKISRDRVNLGTWLCFSRHC